MEDKIREIIKDIVRPHEMTEMWVRSYIDKLMVVFSQALTQEREKKVAALKALSVEYEVTGKNKYEEYISLDEAITIVKS